MMSPYRTSFFYFRTAIETIWQWMLKGWVRGRLRPLAGGVLFGLALVTIVTVTMTHATASEKQFTMLQEENISWERQCADCPKFFSGMGERSLRLTDDGQPHIAYGGDHLYHAWHDGTQWRHEIVDEATGVGQYASLALDGANRPHISYYDAANGDLKYAWYDGVKWHIQVVDSAGNSGQNSSLALDTSGRPHIAYQGNIDDMLKYARYDGTSWTIETIDSLTLLWSEVGDALSLVLDATDKPHITYSWGWATRYGWEETKLNYAYRDGPGWQIETIASASPGRVASFVSSAIDGFGRLHTVFSNGSAVHPIQYAWHDGSDWQMETITDDTGFSLRGRAFSLALDTNNRPHISLHGAFAPYRHRLRYVWHDGVNWNAQILAEADVIFTSLALDNADRPHIGYYDGDQRTLRYAFQEGGTWQSEIVDRASDSDKVGTYSSLALDSLNHPHVSYYDIVKADLRYAQYDGINWQVETIDSAGDVGVCTSLALDNFDRPHVSYIDETNEKVKYTRYDGATWQTETVDDIDAEGYGLERLCPSLALDDNSRPHISYASAAYGDLRYAWFDGVSWQMETVDDLNDGGYPALALGEGDQPYISYANRDSNGDFTLLFARREDTGWQTEVVDPALLTVIPEVSLKLDGTGNPHIGYKNWVGQDIYVVKHAWHDGTDWQLEIVEQAASVGNVSLALDGGGAPHISYISQSDPNFIYALRYAQVDASTWHTETVEVLGPSETGQSTSLALDRANRPHISYYHSGTRGLKYARPAPPIFSLEKQATPLDGLHNNETLIYTLILSGSGLGVQLWDPLPANVNYVDGSLTPPAVYSPTARAVTWQGTLPTDTVQTITFQVTPGITGTGSLSLSLPIVNTAWVTDTDYGRTTSATVIVNGRRAYLPVSAKN